MLPKISRILSFYLHGERYGIDLSLVAEVVDRPLMQPIPRTPSYFLGMMHIHGTPVPALDLGAYLEPGRGTEGGQVLTLAPEVANLALLVESAGRIEPTTEIIPSLNELELFPWIARLAEEDVRLLDVEQLLEWLTTALAGS